MDTWQIWIGIDLTIIAVYYLIALLRGFGGTWRTRP